MDNDVEKMNPEKSPRDYVERQNRFSKTNEKKSRYRIDTGNMVDVDIYKNDENDVLQENKNQSNNSPLSTSRKSVTPRRDQPNEPQPNVQQQQPNKIQNQPKEENLQKSEENNSVYNDTDYYDPPYIHKSLYCCRRIGQMLKFCFSSIRTSTSSFSLVGLLIIIGIDTITSSLATVYWYRLNKTALQYAFLYSQIYFTLSFVIMIWPIYFLQKFSKKIFPGLFGKDSSQKSEQPRRPWTQSGQSSIANENWYTKCLNLSSCCSKNQKKTRKLAHYEEENIVLTGEEEVAGQNSSSPPSGIFFLFFPINFKGMVVVVMWSNKEKKMWKNLQMEVEKFGSIMFSLHYWIRFSIQ